MDELELQLPFAEGVFFPETYFVPRGASDLSVLQRAHDAMMSHLMTAWQNRGPNLELDSPEQALVLASIIEKESDGLADRAHQPSFSPSAEKEHEAANRSHSHLYAW